MIFLPAHLDQELRFRRFLTYRDLPAQRRGDDGRYVCRWCLSPCPGQRRSFCSEECEKEFLVRYNGNFVRHYLLERDRGICAHCGLDCEATERLYCRAKRLRPRCTGDEFFRQWGSWHRLKTYTMWDADHIVPVSEGGGCCGLDNYRTLCVMCHKTETAALAARATPASASQSARGRREALHNGLPHHPCRRA